ncbi:MAG: hypothetical protein COU32_03470 [Candidatus Magasanikbacteria bacterium CG10_big_fil_rev_8_21_14_0_10_42_10]|uniref:YgjP-like metallopeptidase domain-containing protein n=2 Tax=Candidatus Magasanikiibacteriota TaxID=1752731 RepID=A0A2H0TVK9_9BACT|nr:MAG: hypothetical protein COU32_03470 [Candidatus Magasanikbacteria bacterium CG10_big_fil_rev_8_21_14_0_10_42_10]PIZ93797.1 MAG: hypothetical protein COX82_01955 [Candidatus Magasanikbacteria bacterium CG_4_10_14_0_2_um_filter_41_10]
MPPSYTIKRHARSKHIRITVNADAKVIVTAPRHVSEQRVRDFFDAQVEWVEQVLARMQHKKKMVVPDGITQDTLAACRGRALRFVRDRLRQYNEHYAYTYHRISIKKMSSRWGSCSSEGNMSFHYRLLFLPVELADYVIVHELCHLKELNHSHRFWKLVGETIPDYAKRKHALDTYHI